MASGIYGARQRAASTMLVVGALLIALGLPQMFSMAAQATGSSSFPFSSQCGSYTDGGWKIHIDEDKTPPKGSYGDTKGVSWGDVSWSISSTALYTVINSPSPHISYYLNYTFTGSGYQLKSAYLKAGNAWPSYSLSNIPNQGSIKLPKGISHVTLCFKKKTHTTTTTTQPTTTTTKATTTTTTLPPTTTTTKATTTTTTSTTTTTLPPTTTTTTLPPTTTTTSTTTTSTTTTSTTTTTLPPTTTTTTTLPSTTTTVGGPDTTTTSTTSTSTTTTLPSTTTTVGGPDETTTTTSGGSTSTTSGATTTTVLGPDDEELPDTGVGLALSIASTGLGSILAGSGFMALRAGARARREGFDYGFDPDDRDPWHPDWRD